MEFANRVTSVFFYFKLNVFMFTFSCIRTVLGTKIMYFFYACYMQRNVCLHLCLLAWP